MNYNKLNTLLQGRCFHQRKLANNTIASRQSDGTFVIRLHQTNILTFSANGAIRYNTGGWHTTTTKSRLNAYGAPHIYIHQHKHEWFVRDLHNGTTEAFFEGFTTSEAAATLSEVLA